LNSTTSEALLRQQLLRYANQNGVGMFAQLRPRLAAEREKKRGDFRALIISTFGNYQ
jgi:hypothetical protein